MFVFLTGCTKTSTNNRNEDFEKTLAPIESTIKSQDIVTTNCPKEENTTHPELVTQSIEEPTTANLNSGVPKTTKAKEPHSSKQIEEKIYSTTNKPIATTEAYQNSMEQYATSKDEKIIANKVIEYINTYRSFPLIQLPGLTKYAEYRSKQLVTNYNHDTNDERTAATDLKYGQYINPKDWDPNSTEKPFYQAGCAEAIGQTKIKGTIDEVAKALACGVRNSPAHWAYVGQDTAQQYIAVGIHYENKTWYCCIAVATNNTDQM